MTEWLHISFKFWIIILLIILTLGRATHFHLVLYWKLHLLISSCCWRPNEVFFYSYEICWLNQWLDLSRGQKSAMKVWEGRRGYNDWMGNSYNALQWATLRGQESARKVWEGRRGYNEWMGNSYNTHICIHYIICILRRWFAQVFIFEKFQDNTLSRSRLLKEEHLPKT